MGCNSRTYHWINLGIDQGLFGLKCYMLEKKFTNSCIHFVLSLCAHDRCASVCVYACRYVCVSMRIFWMFNMFFFVIDSIVLFNSAFETNVVAACCHFVYCSVSFVHSSQISFHHINKFRFHFGSRVEISMLLVQVNPRKWFWFGWGKRDALTYRCFQMYACNFNGNFASLIVQ